MEKLGQVDMDHTERQVVCISQDSFYRELTPAEKTKAEKGLFNFDHPGKPTSLNTTEVCDIAPVLNDSSFTFSILMVNVCDLLIPGLSRV
jgi:hypothetical protein